MAVSFTRGLTQIFNISTIVYADGRILYIQQFHK